MKRIGWTLLCLACLLTAGCKSSDAGLPVIEDELEINGLGDDHWTYFSIEEGRTVGTSTFLSEEEDAEWARRADWDLAICGDYIKTNSGASGQGKGGLLKEETNHFLLIEEAPETGYRTDETGIVKE